MNFMSAASCSRRTAWRGKSRSAEAEGKPKPKPRRGFRRFIPFCRKKDEHQRQNEGMLTPLCTSYLAGIVATELIVFDCGPLQAAHAFYTASVPSLFTWPELLRILLPVLGIAFGTTSSLVSSAVSRPRQWTRFRWHLAAATLLSGLGSLSLFMALDHALDFCSHFELPLGIGKASAAAQLLFVREWHAVMLLTLLVAIGLQLKARTA